MSIESLDGLDSITDALEALRSAYVELARVHGAHCEMTTFAIACTRAEAVKVFQGRVDAGKAALVTLGFNKPVVRVESGVKDEGQTKGISGSATAADQLSSARTA